jgi:hypothetical protein
MKVVKTNTTELIVRLSKSEISFIKEYAKKHGVTVSELIDRYIKRLRASQKHPLHPDVEKITGIIPNNIDAEALYHKYMLEKHK